MSSPLKQINATQEILNPSLRQHTQNVTNEIPVSFFKRAVVVDVICDISLLTPQEIDRLAGKIEDPNKPINVKGTSDKVANSGQSTAATPAPKKGSVSFKEYLDTIPRNTIIARITSMCEDKTSTTNIICYPFFPPHICLPVKAGEQVWVMFESPDVTNKIGYWISRISEPDFVDDINYTHSDRKFQNITAKTSSDKAASSSGTAVNPKPPGFFNGDPDGQNGKTLRTDDEKEKPYDTIFNESIANKTFEMEPVPRYTKRPGDMVLQGSNNSLISLGQDRGWNKTTRPANVSNASNAKPKAFSGTIDIVAGRGRFPSTPNPDAGDIVDTMPRVIRNEKGILEVDKNPSAYINDPRRSKIKENKLDKPAEGDPDFVHDASRLYVSMNTSGDKNFSSTDILPSFMKNNHNVKDVDDAPFIIVKSNEIRIISRHTTPENGRKEEKGSIRIIREDSDGKKVCSLVMTNDGKILIDAEKIIIGDGRNDQIFLGDKATEAAVLGDTLVALLSNFCSTASTSVGNLGAPIASLVAACNTLSAQLEQIKSSVTKVK
jgi:hypothetical protein